MLIVFGLCWLGFAGMICAQNLPGNRDNPQAKPDKQQEKPDKQEKPDNKNRHSVPEIDGGAATGALVIAAGALTLLGERLRRPSA